MRVFSFTLLQAITGASLSTLGALVFIFSFRRLQLTLYGKILAHIISLPFFIPSIVGCLALILTFGQNGLLSHIWAFLGLSYTTIIYGFTGIILCHVFYYLPFALRIFSKSLDMIQPEYNRLSQQLGLSRWGRLYYIEWPFLKNDLLSTFGIIFMYCLRSFTTVLILGGTPKSTTLEVSIFQAINFDGDLEVAAQLALAQFLTTGGWLCIFQWLKRTPSLARPPLQKNGAFSQIKIFDIFFILVSFSFFFLPVALIFLDGVSEKIITLLRQGTFWEAFSLSMLIGILTAAITIYLAYSLIYLSFFSEKKTKWSALYSFFIYLAENTSLLFSSTVLGTSLYFLFFERTKNSLYIFLIVIFLNSILFLPNVVRILKTPFHVQYLRYEKLCSLLDIKGIEKWRKIDRPILKEPVGYALLTCIIFSLGDAKTILFFSPSFENITSLLYRKMNLHAFEEAASIGTLLIIISLIIGFGIKKMFKGSNINYDQN